MWNYFVLEHTDIYSRISIIGYKVYHALKILFFHDHNEIIVKEVTMSCLLVSGFKYCIITNVLIFLVWCSICIGNVFMILVLRDKAEWDNSVSNLVFTVLAVVCVFGTLILMVLRPSLDVQGRENEVEQQQMTNVNPIQEMKKSISLFLTKDMCLLSTLFFFTGEWTHTYTTYYPSLMAYYIQGIMVSI